MLKKVIGYLLALVGIFLIALTIDSVKKFILGFVKFQIPAQITNLYLMIGGGVLVLLGILLLKSETGSSKKLSEVPIYQGKNVVGYRRFGK